ncbi:MAG: bifunctional adenosylcobinamide kinase/adenosylcobinamide-phosphate guanylyltransferase [Myxococcales bacterium]|nr:bifunctional adenosylcobinamide kinase/adenosylcobinamide-phosphate guanylyltransferase [Myxococcales bacterium]
MRSKAKLAELVARTGAGSVRLQVYHYDSGLVGETPLPLGLERVPSRGLATARSVWLQAGAAVPESFQRTARERFSAEVLTADFRGVPTAARAAIVAWLAHPLSDASGTPRLLGDFELDPDTRLILIDRFALEAEWSRPFPPAAPGDFHTAEGTTTRLPLMRQEGLFPAAEAAGVSVVELPFADGRRSLVIALPADPSTSPEAIAPTALAEALGALAGVDVVVVDCVTHWISNLLLARPRTPVEAILEATDAVVRELERRRYHTILVTNEVGMSVHPPSEIGRLFVEVCGWVHQRIARAADDVYLAVLGMVVPIRGGAGREGGSEG